MTLGIGIAIASVWYFAVCVVPHDNLKPEEAKYHAFIALLTTAIIMIFTTLMSLPDDTCKESQRNIHEEMYM